MEIERNEEKKIISVWLTKAEPRDENLQRRLKSMYPKWKNEKYLVAGDFRRSMLFRCGDGADDRTGSPGRRGDFRSERGDAAQRIFGSGRHGKRKLCAVVH